MCVVSQIEQINEYWTGGPCVSPETFGAKQKCWYQSTKDIDAYIRKNFGATHLAAENGHLSTWSTSHQGAVALITLLDQFTRNLYRASIDAYRNDDQARKIAVDVFLKDDCSQLTVPQTILLVHPLHHAEDIELQLLGLRMMEHLKKHGSRQWQDVIKKNLTSILNHEKIIARFGRFPHRNQILGRDSTVAERRYLSNDKRNYGQAR
ncbi:MAG: hypothetical protein ACI8Z1_000726 [Candidatus Azotimanducaceae bacterium]|jgi:uncharacterized protein (DUF924 family)